MTSVTRILAWWTISSAWGMMPALIWGTISTPATALTMMSRTWTHRRLVAQASPTQGQKFWGTWAVSHIPVIPQRHRLHCTQRKTRRYRAGVSRVPHPGDHRSKAHPHIPDHFADDCTIHSSTGYGPLPTTTPYGGRKSCFTSNYVLNTYAI